MDNLGWCLFALNPESPPIQPRYQQRGEREKEMNTRTCLKLDLKRHPRRCELRGCHGGFSRTYPPQYYHICSKLQYQASPNKSRIRLDDKILVACGWACSARSRSFSKSLGWREEIRAGPSGCVIMDVPCRILSIDIERRRP